MRRERPILYSAPMVLAKLAGRKTQTRRTTGLEEVPCDSEVSFAGLIHTRAWFASFYPKGRAIKLVRCPYGGPGDRLWGRETFATTGKPHVAYRADGTCLTRVDNGGEWELWHGGYLMGAAKHEKVGRWWTLPKFGGKWKPSIFMPRWASRLFDEVVSVRVERLQDISEADAMAEGIVATPSSTVPGGFLYSWPGGDGPGWTLAKLAYLAGWDWLNGDGAAAKNPWVWRIETRPVPR